MFMVTVDLYNRQSWAHADDQIIHSLQGQYAQYEVEFQNVTERKEERKNEQ